MARKSQSSADTERVPSFEDNLTRLESLVQRLEESELPLEEALKLFEEGTALSASCRKQLEEAEQRVEVLTKRASGVVAEPLEDATEES